jgi:hypothetical protein
MSDVTKMASPVDRSFVGMRDTLFDALDGIRGGTIDHKQVDGIAKITSQISKSVDVELKVRKLMQQTVPAQPKNEQHETFKLGTSKS